MTATMSADAVEVREIFVRAVAEHYHLELHETASAVWVERFPGLVYMGTKAAPEAVPA